MIVDHLETFTVDDVGLLMLVIIALCVVYEIAQAFKDPGR